METRREVLEEWIDELQCWLDELPEGVVRASLADTHEMLCKALFANLSSTGELEEYGWELG